MSYVERIAPPSFLAGMPRARTFRELRAYQKALDEADVIFKKTLTFPADERFALSEQMRRSSTAVSGLIAEAWARRDYERAFKNTLSIALAEATETQAWLDSARRRSYISEAEYDDMDAAWRQIGAMLFLMIRKAATFRRR